MTMNNPLTEPLYPVLGGEVLKGKTIYEYVVEQIGYYRVPKEIDLRLFRGSDRNAPMVPFVGMQAATQGQLGFLIQYVAVMFGAMSSSVQAPGPEKSKTRATWIITLLRSSPRARLKVFSKCTHDGWTIFQIGNLENPAERVSRLPFFYSEADYRASAKQDVAHISMVVGRPNAALQNGLGHVPKLSIDITSTSSRTNTAAIESSETGKRCSVVAELDCTTSFVSPPSKYRVFTESSGEKFYLVPEKDMWSPQSILAPVTTPEDFPMSESLSALVASSPAAISLDLGDHAETASQPVPLYTVPREQRHEGRLELLAMRRAMEGHRYPAFLDDVKVDRIFDRIPRGETNMFADVLSRLYEQLFSHHPCDEFGFLPPFERVAAQHNFCVPGQPIDEDAVKDLSRYNPVYSDERKVLPWYVIGEVEKSAMAMKPVFMNSHLCGWLEIITKRRIADAEKWTDLVLNDEYLLSTLNLVYDVIERGIVMPFILKGTETQKPYLAYRLRAKGTYLHPGGAVYHTYPAHKLVVNTFVHNEHPYHFYIGDHLNGCSLDNSVDNLAHATPSQNRRNRCLWFYEPAINAELVTHLRWNPEHSSSRPIDCCISHAADTSKRWTTGFSFEQREFAIRTIHRFYFIFFHLHRYQDQRKEFEEVAHLFTVESYLLHINAKEAAARAEALAAAAAAAAASWVPAPTVNENGWPIHTAFGQCFGMWGRRY
jgi:hypothetical protein